MSSIRLKKIGSRLAHQRELSLHPRTIKTLLGDIRFLLELVREMSLDLCEHRKLPCLDCMQKIKDRSRKKASRALKHHERDEEARGEID